jgi:hypothetical protein
MNFTKISDIQSNEVKQFTAISRLTNKIRAEVVNSCAERLFIGIRIIYDDNKVDEFDWKITIEYQLGNSTFDWAVRKINDRTFICDDILYTNGEVKRLGEFINFWVNRIKSGG